MDRAESSKQALKFFEEAGEVYAAGTEEEAHQFLLNNYPATKRKMKNGPNNIIRVYPEPLYKKKVRGDRI